MTAGLIVSGTGAGPFWFEDEDEVRLKKGMDEGPSRLLLLAVLLRGCATGVTLKLDLVSFTPPWLDWFEGRLSKGEGNSDFWISDQGPSGDRASSLVSVMAGE
jgi:hypothetical protein